MPMTLPAGPYRELTTPEGQVFPYYIIPFDKHGRCEAPKTRQHLIDEANKYSDIFLFSHGWNNDWTVAGKRYEHFVAGVQNLREQYQLPVPPNYRPLLVGVFWPSQALAWFASEVGPEMAGTGGTDSQDAALMAQILDDIASDLPAERQARFRELARATELDKVGASELVTMLASLTTPDQEAGVEPVPSPEDLLAAAAAFSPEEPDYDAVGTATGSSTAPDAAFDIGKPLKKLDPRNLLKPFTVWQMKDRAGKVGAHGVSKLLEDLLTKSSARIHLLGHSFGCKVVMTAVCTPSSLPRKVESALLLQGAVSQYAFAPTVPNRNVAGGFVAARERIRRPIVATFSSHDRALTSFFHLAVRRHDDLGELQFAGGPPSRFAALGGYGPQASDEEVVTVHHANVNYDFSGTGRLIGLEASRAVSGHGDISNESTWWVAYSLATAHLRYPEPPESTHS